VEKYDRAGQAADDNKIQRMRFVCCITKATDTHSEYVILIDFPRQHWLSERALCYVTAHCLFCLLQNSTETTTSFGAQRHHGDAIHWATLHPPPPIAGRYHLTRAVAFIPKLRRATGWSVRGSNLSEGEIFRTLSDRPWGPPSLL
jgi:hypothetical protein